MIRIVSLVLFLLAPAFSQAQPDFWVRAASAHLGNGEIISPAVVRISDGKIAAVAADLAPPPGARVLDLGDAVLTPGFVDGLSHLGLARGAAENEEGSEVTPAARVSGILDSAADGFAAALRLGVTTLAIHPGARNVIGGLTCLVKPRDGAAEKMIVQDGAALRITLGTDAHVGNRSPTSGGIGLFHRRPNSRMGIVYDVREAFARARDAKTGDADPDGDVLRAAMAGKIPVHWVARAEKEILAALRLAAEFGIPRNVIVEGHQAGAAAEELKARGVPVLLGPLFNPQSRGGGRRFNEEYPLPHAGEECEAGRADACGHGHGVAAHPESESESGAGAEEHTVPPEPPMSPEEEAAFLAASGCSVCCGPAMAGAVAPQEEEPPALSAPALFRAGVRTAFASGGFRPGESLLDYARFAVRSGLDPKRAIPMLTLEAAKIAGCDDRVGSLASGKDADLVAFDRDPLLPTASVRLVILDGRVVFDAAPRKESP